MTTRHNVGNDNPPIGSGKHHGGYFSGSDRQQANPTLLHHKWENAFTIDAGSWGYDRSANHADYLNMTTILYVSTAASAAAFLRLPAQPSSITRSSLSTPPSPAPPCPLPHHPLLLVHSHIIRSSLSTPPSSAPPCPLLHHPLPEGARAHAS